MLYANARHRPRSIAFRFRRRLELWGDRTIGAVGSFMFGGILGALLVALIVSAY